MKNFWLVTFGLLCVILAALTVAYSPRLVEAQNGGGHQKLYINTAVDTAVKDGLGYLDAVTINGGTGGTVTLYDIGATGCTGTPGSGKFAVIEAATAPVTLPYGVRFANGLCVVTAAATDATVSFD